MFVGDFDTVVETVEWQMSTKVPPSLSYSTVCQYGRHHAVYFNNRQEGKSVE